MNLRAHQRTQSSLEFVEVWPKSFRWNLGSYELDLQSDNWEVGIVRTIFASCLLLSLIPSFGTTLLIYFIMHFFLPAHQASVVDVEAKELN